MTPSGPRPRVVVIERHELGPRLHLAGRRVHHGLTGLALVVLGAVLRGRFGAAAAAIGGAMIGHDAHDFPWTPRREELGR